MGVSVQMDFYQKGKTVFRQEGVCGDHAVLGKGRANDRFASRQEHVRIVVHKAENLNQVYRPQIQRSVWHLFSSLKVAMSR